jgi:hypothetical protein
MAHAGISAHTGLRLAEVGYLLFVIAGVWLAVGQVPRFNFARSRTIVAGLLLSAGGVLLIVATHWGHYR